MLIKGPQKIITIFDRRTVIKRTNSSSKLTGNSASQPIQPKPLDSIPARVEELLARMTLEEKIGQMTLVEKNKITADEVRRLAIGAVLSGVLPQFV
jgi:hypothetical protein